MAHECGRHQRGCSITILNVHICTSLNESFAYLYMSKSCRPVKRRSTSKILLIGIRFGRNMCLNCFEITFTSRFTEILSGGDSLLRL